MRFHWKFYGEVYISGYIASCSSRVLFGETSSTTAGPTLPFETHHKPSARETKVSDVNEGKTVSKLEAVVTLYRFTTCTWLWSKLSWDGCYKCRHHRNSGRTILDLTKRNPTLLLPTQRSGFKEIARHPALRWCENQSNRIDGETVTRSKARGDAAARLATSNVRVP